MTDLLNKVTQGDCLDLMREIADGSVSSVITSPPYNLGGDFHTFVGGKRVSYGGYAGKRNDSLDEESYQLNQINVLNEIYRVLCDDGFLFYNHKNRIKDGRVISPLDWISKTKFIVSQIVVLNFKSTANVDKRRFFPVHELLFVLKKRADARLFNEECLTDVWDMRKVPRKISGHPATFHIDLPLRCIRALGIKNGIILDPYAGTGTTLLAARNSNLDFIGFEFEESYKTIAEERLLS